MLSGRGIRQKKSQVTKMTLFQKFDFEVHNKDDNCRVIVEGF